jgi:hypothetical protein
MFSWTRIVPRTESLKMEKRVEYFDQSNYEFLGTNLYQGLVHIQYRKAESQPWYP